MYILFNPSNKTARSTIIFQFQKQGNETQKDFVIWNFNSSVIPKSVNLPRRQLHASFGKEKMFSLNYSHKSVNRINKYKGNNVKENLWFKLRDEKERE